MEYIRKYSRLVAEKGMSFQKLVTVYCVQGLGGGGREGEEHYF